ncbi:hypothetical protein [Candidatus Odyssella acanthamoebae]|uniref:Uncharacterized protein n=1 Tax=Candidatus Odyssella acanthamoebae TaxID=91604 RepID=A0A077ATP4_9PROT|nr:hypothetical protein [Candidatus Paracaedibacter acanthamoebae]AIK96552.1 hypothetical protein ID47_07090 [Candidatus Paracaedibacter acanthamoebae]
MKKLTHTLSVITLGVIEIISFSSTVKAYDSTNQANRSVHQRNKNDRDALKGAQPEQDICWQWKNENSRLLHEIQELNGDESQQGLRMYGEYINNLKNEAETKEGQLYSEMLKHAQANFNVLQLLYNQGNFSAIKSLVSHTVHFGGQVVPGQYKYSFDIWLLPKQQ